MPLRLLPLELQDFDELISHAASYPPGQDLVGLPTPLCCKVTTQEEALARLTFHFAKQRTRFTSDPTVRYMKVVDTDGPSDTSIVSIARWHFYPRGYSFASEAHWELQDAAVPGGQPVPKGFDVGLHNHILTTRDAARPSWIKADAPCWILMHMVTHPAHRGKGAAGLLVKWGIEQAEKDGVPAYLEAGVMGRPIYERYGFVQVGELLEVDLSAFGIEGNLSEFGMGVVIVMWTMAYFPKSMTGREEEIKIAIES
ncbi:hypothetical protein N0V90_001259 [Kalmusia sp. IMI 367209]|nr:hypothetical protein N0V90_001259 [Kalmusia sp. IMI 367209]